MGDLIFYSRNVGQFLFLSLRSTKICLRRDRKIYSVPIDGEFVKLILGKFTVKSLKFEHFYRLCFVKCESSTTVRILSQKKNPTMCVAGCRCIKIYLVEMTTGSNMEKLIN